MKTVLSVENALTWSWGTTFYQLQDRLENDYEFVRMVGVRGMEIQKLCDNCKEKVKMKVSPLPIADDILRHFDLTLLQNVCSLTLLKNHFKKAICRIGGFFVNKNNPDNRYDEELKKVGAVIATNRQLFDIGFRNNEKTFLIPNGVDLDVFKPPVRESDPKRRTFTIGFAGNIWGMGMEYKGYKYFVQAEISLYGLVESKKFLHAHNQIPHNEMPEKFYHQIDCLVLPSQGEGCSNVVTEALACGVAVLTTPVGFHGERLTDGENCLFIKRDSADIVQKVKMLINDRALLEKIKFNARLFAEQNHDIKETAANYDRVFREVLEMNQKI